MTRAALLRLTALTLALGVPGPASAQELGAYAVDGRSDNAELRRTDGYGGSAVLPVADWILLRIGIETQRGSAEREGLTCPSAASRFGCTVVEPIRSTTRMDGLSLALMPSWEPIRQIRLAAGAGLAVAQMRHEAVGVSGRPALVVNPRSAHAGLALVAELFVQPFPVIPLAVTAALQQRVLFLSGCLSGEPDHQPFCGRQGFGGVQLGGAIVLR